MTVSAAPFIPQNRSIIMEELRRLMPGKEALRTALPFGLSALDSHLPQGGLTCGSLHEIVPEDGATAAAFGFMAALLTRLSTPFFIPLPERGSNRQPLAAVPQNNADAERRLRAERSGGGQRDDPSPDRFSRSDPPF
jgi:hypothetical protein